MKILILYANFGEGHLQVSKALLHHFHNVGIQNVQLVDLYAEARPWINSITQFTYRKSTAYTPFIYGWSYDLTLHWKHNQHTLKWMNTLCMRKLKEIIVREKPDAVINTFPNLAMSELRVRFGVDIPIYTVLTDFVLHGRWIHAETDKYFVATEDLKKRLGAVGIREDKVQVSGIPIRAAFRRSLDRRAILQSYKLAGGDKYILIMAGLYGAKAQLQKMVRTLLAVKGVQFLIVCGRDQALLSKMLAAFADEPRVHLFGYVDPLEELMAVSTCMITKAGGVTLAEALALQVPVVVFRPIPGQEKANARYLGGIGAVMTADQLEELKISVERLLSSSWEMERMKQAMRSVQKYAAAECVVANVLQGVERRSRLPSSSRS